MEINNNCLNLSLILNCLFFFESYCVVLKARLTQTNQFCLQIPTELSLTFVADQVSKVALYTLQQKNPDLVDQILCFLYQMPYIKNSEYASEFWHQLHTISWKYKMLDNPLEFWESGTYFLREYLAYAFLSQG